MILLQDKHGGNVPIIVSPFPLPSFPASIRPAVQPAEIATAYCRRPVIARRRSRRLSGPCRSNSRSLLFLGLRTTRNELHR